MCKYCLVIVCDTLENPVNGMVTVSGATINSTANYLCNDGYALIGEALRMCQRNRQWSGDEPKCAGMHKIAVESWAGVLYKH